MEKKLERAEPGFQSRDQRLKKKRARKNIPIFKKPIQDVGNVDVGRRKGYGYGDTDTSDDLSTCFGEKCAR